MGVSETANQRTKTGEAWERGYDTVKTFAKLHMNFTLRYPQQHAIIVLGQTREAAYELHTVVLLGQRSKESVDEKSMRF